MASIFDFGYFIATYLLKPTCDLRYFHDFFRQNGCVRVGLGAGPGGVSSAGPNRHALARNQKVNRSGEVLKITWPLITHKHSRFGSHEVHTKILYRQSYLISVTKSGQNWLKSANLDNTASFDEFFSC